MGGKSDSGGIFLARWKYITKPKEVGALGLKHIHIFGKSLKSSI